MHTLSQPSRAQLLSEAFLEYCQKLIKLTTLSGVALAIAAAGALLWCNFHPQSYQAFWHTSVSFSLGELTLASSLHFIVNDILMAIFFLAVGMEIRHELHSGSLSNLRNTLIPISGAVGGVLVPATIFLAFNGGGNFSAGWAIPTATDIAFALGVVAVLGSRIPVVARLFLLTLAVTDDIIAIAIIAIFYSEDIAPIGFAIVAAGLLLVKLLQHCGATHALAYVPAGAVVWWGFLTLGVHPTLAGVILGLMTPVTTKPSFEAPLEALRRNLLSISIKQYDRAHGDDIQQEVAAIARVQRELIAPVVRVNNSLHPWVNFVIMPLFALANAGILIEGVEMSPAILQLSAGVVIALLIGKPLGIIGAVWLMEKSGLAARDPALSWRMLLILGVLGGIGFTMSIFVTNLALVDPAAQAAAKLAVLVASLAAIVVGVGLSLLLLKPASRRASNLSVSH